MDFKGILLRKDFPLSGFTESRYNVTKNRVVYENLELAQEYRTFEFLSPWENFNK
jgi:NADH-quinone oxidoreductase subunit C